MIKIPLALVVGRIIALLTIADITIHTIYKITITNKNSISNQNNTLKTIHSNMHACMYAIWHFYLCNTLKIVL